VVQDGGEAVVGRFEAIFGDIINIIGKCGLCRSRPALHIESARAAADNTAKWLATMATTGADAPRSSNASKATCLPDAYHRIHADPLRSFAEDLFLAAGTPPDIAERVAEIVIRADLSGHPSHGVFRIIGYMSALERERLVADARPEVLDERPGVASVDGKRGWGHYSAQWSMDLAIRKAKETGIACVSLRNYSHIGRLGEYVEQAAATGCVSMITLGEGRRGVGPAAPYGGTETRLLTNPFTIGAPAGDDTPFVSDFATTVVANGKIRVAREEERDLPPGAIVDKNHTPSVNPDDWFGGGQSVIFGGHKGYALSLATCLLGGLTGTSTLNERACTASSSPPSTSAPSSLRTSTPRTREPSSTL